jgi:integrase
LGSTARQKQARGLTWAEIELFLSVEPRNLRDVRDRSLVAVAYDTMCRREELVLLRVEDIAEGSDGSGSILIRRSKTDTTGEGATAYLSPLTMQLLSAWLRESGLKTGPVFVRVHGAVGVAESLTAQNVATVLKKVGQWIGLDKNEWVKISGHSARVGAAQDLLALKYGPTFSNAGRQMARHTHADALRGEDLSRKRCDGTSGQEPGASLKPLIAGSYL